MSACHSQRSEKSRAEPSAKIRWAPRLRPQLLQRLYDSDAAGLRDLDLCDEVGMILYMRCRTFALVHHNQVECPQCRTVFEVVRLRARARCPREGCTGIPRKQRIRPASSTTMPFTGRAIACLCPSIRAIRKPETIGTKCS